MDDQGSVEDQGTVGGQGTVVDGSSRRGVPWGSSGCWSWGGRAVVAVAGTARRAAVCDPGIDCLVVVFELDKHKGFGGIEIQHCRELHTDMLVSAEVASAVGIHRAAGTKDLGSWALDRDGEQRLVDQLRDSAGPAVGLDYSQIDRWGCTS